MNNAARNFDRLTYIDTLKEAGIDEGSARAHANALDAAMRDGLATKQDMQTIDKAFVSVERRFMSIDQRFTSIDQRFETIDAKMDVLDAKINALDQKFETKFDVLDHKIDRVEMTLRAEIKTSEATVRAEIAQSANRTVIWLGGTMIALSGIVLAVVKLAP